MLVIIASIARLIIAATVELGNDEVYYWTYAQQLQWNYFDHPPMVGWLIRITTANLLLHHEIFVRLGAVISSAICTILVYNAGTEASNGNNRVGWYAALLYTASIYGSIIAGTFILPDSPQMAFWLWGILLLLKIFKRTHVNNNARQYWLWFGVAAGICIMCKVHGIFLWGGVGLYILTNNRKWLGCKELYIAMAITVVIISPIVIWNVQNNFISYAFHGGRVNIAGKGFEVTSFLRELGGSFFYNNPINFILSWMAVLAFFKKKTDKHMPPILLYCSLPLIVTLLLVSLFRDTLPHWSGPAYSSLIILAAIHLNETKTTIFPAAIKYALFFIIITSIGGALLINYYPGTLAVNKTGIKTGEGDFTLDMYGWREASNTIDSIFKQDAAEKMVSANAPIIINKWFPAAHIDFYIAHKTGREVLPMGKLFDLHQYHWLHQYKKPLLPGSNAYLIIPSNVYSDETIAFNRQYFDSISAPVVIPQYRSGVLCRNMYVYKLIGFKAK